MVEGDVMAKVACCGYCGLMTLDALLNEHLLECRVRKDYWDECQREKLKHSHETQESTSLPAESPPECNPPIAKPR